MDNDKDIKPNSEARLQSAILSLRNTYCKYRKKMITYFRNSGYDSNGNFYVLGDKDKLNRDIMELSNKWYYRYTKKRYRRRVQ